jgi:K+ transporter
MSTTAIVGDQRSHTPGGSLGALALGALGVVYGDIGISPLYSVAYHSQILSCQKGNEQLAVAQLVDLSGGN